MGVMYFSKKQKRLMKARQKKKKLYDTGKIDSTTDQETNTADDERITKRPRTAISTSSEKYVAPISAKHKPVVVIPATLSGKGARKFRKDARRKVRSSNGTAEICFVVEGKEHENEATTKKKKRKFPKLNELVEQERKEKELNINNGAQDTDLFHGKTISDEQKAKYVAMDCEMVGIGREGKQSALARVSLVDWDGEVLLDTHVKVPVPVTDFRTFVSGIKPKHISNKSATAMDAAECRDKVADILKDKILVGHALVNDLRVLLITHPEIRDTAKYRKFQRYGGNKWRPRRLRDIVKEFCGETIQEDGAAHDSIQDAAATMSVFRTVQRVWEEEIELKKSKQRRKK